VPPRSPLLRYIFLKYRFTVIEDLKVP